MQHHSAVDGVPGPTLQATDVSYGVTVNGQYKIILRNVKLAVYPGDLCAMMGSSGAGKSTLLDLLADRKLDGRWSGAITVEGQPRTASFPQEIAYVLQDDLLIHNLTVEETLQYAAWVRMGDAVPVEKKQERVEELLQIMGLAHIRHSQVGNATVRGISGGQVKRLCIAVETISLPRLVFLDEPTSGLDSAMALEVMTVVRNFTTTQRTCLATVHQPSKAIFDLFDKVGILAAGRVVYFGPADKAVSYFTQPELGYTMKQKYKNPAEFLVEISCGQHLPEGFAKPRQPHELSRLFAASKFLSSDVLEKSDSASTAVLPSTAVVTAQATAAPGALRYASSQWSQLQMLLSRTWTARVRDTADMSAQAIKSVAIGFLIGVVFYGCGEVSSPYFENGSQTSEVHAVNSLFLILVMTTMFMTVTAIPLLFAHVAVYRRELASGVYPPTPYWITQLLTSLPVQIAGNFLTTLMVYMLTQLPARGAYIVYFFLMNIALSVVSLASALAVTAFASTEQTALVLFPIQFMIMTLSAGYAITVDRMPVYWRWVMFIVYNRWAFEGLMINQWQDKDTDDDGGDNHGDILEDYSFDHFTKFGCIAVMALFYAFLALLVLYGLQPKKSKLQHVSAAEMSVLISTAKGPPRDHAVKGIVKDNSSTSGKIRSLGAGNMGGGLKESLLQNDQFSSDSEESNGDAVVGSTYKPTLTVESFRISSGVVETPKGCQLLFRDVAYSVPTKSDPVGEMQVLRGVTGRVSAGEMCALMGASGAGKSTLLDVLAKRKTSGHVTGEITYNGDSNMCTSAYVMQDNVHIDVLTVRETLYFAAQLRLSEQLPKPAKRARVQKILDILALNEVADSEVGGVDERGVSGGQLKRVSIGVEIVHLPDLMFLDEPTTGLDSAIALEVMSAIRNLANQNRTVVCTIHQPSADSFALFDTLLLLADGNVVYFGPTREAVPYFANSPFAFASLQAGNNPADYIVHIANACEPTAGGAPESSDGSGGNRHAGDSKDVPESSPAVTSASLALYYQSSAHHRIALSATDSASLAAISNASLSPSPAASPTVNPLNIQQSAVETPDKTTAATAATGRKYNTSLTHQLATLLERKFLVMSKKRRFYIMILLRESFAAFIHGSVFWQIDTGRDDYAYFERMSLIYFGLTTATAAHLHNISVLIDDRVMFYRERGVGAYGPFAYWVTQVVPQLPLQTLKVLVYCAIVYPMSGLRADSNRFGVFFIVRLGCNFAAMFGAYAIAASTRSTQVAMSYFPLYALFNMMFAGYLVYIPDLPHWLRAWAPYLSFMRYAFQGMVLNEFQDNSDLPEGHEYIDQLGFDFISIGGCFALILLFVALTAWAHYLALVYIDFEDR